MEQASPDTAHSPPLVEVLVTTYNHESFIRRTLESVLMQRTVFRFAVTVIDDFSTDGTRAILDEFTGDARVKIVLAPRNENHSGRLAGEFRRSRAKYVCFLDGDDYWTSPDKLQRQVAFFDRHPECSMVFHNALVVDETGKEAPWKITPPTYPEISTIDLVWGSGQIAACSVMLRRHIVDELPQWYIEAEVADWALNILAGMHGKIGYIDEVMGVYLRHAGGLWTSKQEVEQRTIRIRFYKMLRATLTSEHHAPIDKVLRDAFLDLHSKSRSYWKERRFGQAVSATAALVRHFPAGSARAMLAPLIPNERPPLFSRYPALPALADRLRALGRSSNTPQYQGHVERVDGESISGWVWNRAIPTQRVTLAVRCDDLVVATITADRFREDLLDAGIGDGYHAFIADSPAALRDGLRHTVTFDVAGSSDGIGPAWQVGGAP